ncbi:putative trace amine-associated receptor 8b-like [Apostichopus japonicus]|uniref:Putative trace amine-associated receptor 8b-like n=1 Tax=Stichopus japonicus TaxID=307972 RepID=A0A2G8KHP6_STIJA|nr:putative trace amine-associated receptor 8b-like [Apostichopus japonicus]
MAGRNNQSFNNNIEDLTSDILIFSIFTCGPVILVGTFGNLSVIVVFFRKRHIRTTSNYFMVALMFSVAWVNMVAYPLQAMCDVFLIVTQPMCYLAGAAGIMSSLFMTLFLLATTVERYITICQPLTAHTIITPRRAVTIISFLAFYGVLLGSGFFGTVWIGKGELWRQTRRCNFNFMMPSTIMVQFIIGHWMVPLPVMIFIHLHIFLTVRRHIRAIAAVQCGTIVRPPVGEDPVGLQRGGQGNILAQDGQRSAHSRLMKEARSAMRLALVIAVHIFNWVPFTVFLLTGVLRSENISPKQYILLHSFVYSTGLVCPYIYGFGNKSIRTEIQAMLCGKCTTSTRDPRAHRIAAITTGLPRQFTM